MVNFHNISNFEKNFFNEQYHKDINPINLFNMTRNIIDLFQHFFLFDDSEKLDSEMSYSSNKNLFDRVIVCVPIIGSVLRIIYDFFQYCFYRKHPLFLKANTALLLGHMPSLALQKAMIRKDLSLFQHADKAVKRDVDFVQSILQKDGLLLQYVPEDLKNRKLVLTAIEQNGFAIEHAGCLQSDTGLLDAAIKKNILVTKCLTEAVSTNCFREICTSLTNAIKNSKQEYLFERIRELPIRYYRIFNDKSFLYELFNKDDWCARHFYFYINAQITSSSDQEASIWYSKEFLKEVLIKNPSDIRYIPERFINQELLLDVLNNSSTETFLPGLYDNPISHLFFAMNPNLRQNSKIMEKIKKICRDLWNHIIKENPEWKTS